MRGEDQQSRVFYQLCALLLAVLRSPHVAIPTSAGDLPPSQRQAGSRAARRRRAQLSPAGFTALLLGASLALMLCGSLTFVIGFILMPWVLGLAMVLSFVGIVSSLSGLGRAILCSASSPSAPRTSPKEMPGHLLSKLPID